MYLKFRVSSFYIWKIWPFLKFCHWYNNSTWAYCLAKLRLSHWPLYLMIANKLCNVWIHTGKHIHPHTLQSDRNCQSNHVDSPNDKCWWLHQQLPLESITKMAKAVTLALLYSGHFMFIAQSFQSHFKWIWDRSISSISFHDNYFHAPYWCNKNIVIFPFAPREWNNTCYISIPILQWFIIRKKNEIPILLWRRWGTANVNSQREFSLCWIRCIWALSVFFNPHFIV